MRLLGAIIAGGSARRFAGDKAAALLDGKMLIDHVYVALARQVDGIVVCGRDWPGMTSIVDRPAPNMGPLGGLCAALYHAAQHGFDAVLSAGCDVLPVPDLRALVGPTPAIVEEQRLFGYWPVTHAASLATHLASQSDYSIRHWVTVSGARSVACPLPFHNLNTRADFALYAETQGRAA